MDDWDEQTVQTAQLFFDNDTARQIIGHQPVGQDGGPPVPDYERILQVTIPITIEQKTYHNNDRTYYSTDLEIDRLNDVDPIDPGYLPAGELTEDTILKTWLLEPPDLGGPAVIGSGRQLINVDGPLLNDLTDQGVDIERFDRLKPVLDAHERDPTTQGSHADTILDHRSRSAEAESGIIGQMRAVISSPELNDLPSQSGVFQELMAIVNERRVAPHLPEREALDEIRRTTGGEEYTLALDILNWLRIDLSRRLSYTQITDLLHYCRFSTCPDRMLAHFLADLSHGMPPEDIPYHSSYFDREYVSQSPSELYSRQDESLVEFPGARLALTTFETIRLEGEPGAWRLVREWWSYNPPAVVAPSFLRQILVLRRLHQQATRDERSLVNSTTSNGAIGSLSSPDAAFGYQVDDDAAHPLQEAMNTTNPPDLTRLDKRFRRKFASGFDGTSEAIIQVWDRTKQRWLDRQEHLGDNETFSGWISGDAPASTPREVCQYYL